MTAYTLDQLRAIDVVSRHRDLFAAATDWQRKEPFWDDYATAANGLPAAIRINGLLLALTTEYAQAERGAGDGRMALLLDLVAWLIEWSNTQGAGIGGDKPAVLSRDQTTRGQQLQTLRTWITQLLSCHNGRTYKLLHGEALAHLAWLKTLAKANKPDEPRARVEEAP